jgi:predicted transcriptional regulator
MKTAVSIPDELFKGADRLARRTKKSRSRLFSDALREYLARHAADELTEAMDRVCAELGETPGETKDAFVSAAARRALERSEW